MKKPFLFFIFACACVYSSDKESVFISLAHDAKQPYVASEGSNIYLLWLDNRDGSPNVYFRSSPDEGLSWSNDIRLSSGTNPFCYPPVMAAAGGTIHAAWLDFGEIIDGQVNYARSADGGSSWDKTAILCEDANSARFPSIFTEQKNIFLVWQDAQEKIYFRASHDSGGSWGQTGFITKLNYHSCYCYPPALVSAGKDVYLSYTDCVGKGKDREKGLNTSTLHLRVSTDSGRSWPDGNERVIIKSSAKGKLRGEITNPALVMDKNGTVHLFWIDKHEFKLGQIFHIKSSDGAKTWSSEKIISAEKKSPKRPSAAIDNEGNIHVTWASFLGGNSMVYYRRGENYGEKWNEPVELSPSDMRYHDPVVACTSSGAVHVFWFDESDVYSKIYYARSADSGKTWHSWNYFVNKK